MRSTLGIELPQVELTLLNKTKQKAVETKEGKTSGNVFETMLNEAKQLLDETNKADAIAGKKTEEFILGKNEDIHGLQIAQEKASIMMQFTTQVRNNAIEAYREIMRLPV